MRPIHEVILDLDDVLNRFCMAALHHVGVARWGLDYAEYPARYGWDIVAAANQLKAGCRAPFTANSFWESLDQSFWASVPCVPYLNKLLTYLEHRVGRDNVIIATSPTLSPACPAGKLEWIHTFLPKWLHRQYMIGPCKDRLANPYALLIDDRPENCAKFEDRGGHSLLVHKPWSYDPLAAKWVDWDAITLRSLQLGLFQNFGKQFEV